MSATMTTAAIATIATVEIARGTLALFPASDREKPEIRQVICGSSRLEVFESLPRSVEVRLIDKDVVQGWGTLRTPRSR